MNTPRSTKKTAAITPTTLANRHRFAQHNDSYVVYDNKVAQTSFALSQNDDDESAEKREMTEESERKEVSVVVLSSSSSVASSPSPPGRRIVSESSENSRSGEDSIIEIVDDDDENQDDSLTRNTIAATTSNLMRRLDLSSPKRPATLAQSFTPNVTMRKKSDESRVETDANPKTLATDKLPSTGNKKRSSMFSSKRVSVCGIGSHENDDDDVLLSIDDTIIDEYDNELDHRTGKLVSQHTVLSSIRDEDEEAREPEDSEDDAAKMPPPAILVSMATSTREFDDHDKSSPVRKPTTTASSSSDDDRRFEQCK